jgi:hypothetical protein
LKCDPEIDKYHLQELKTILSDINSTLTEKNHILKKKQLNLPKNTGISEKIKI